MTTHEVDSYVGPASITLKGREPIEVDCRYVVEQDSAEAERRGQTPGVKRWRGTFSTASSCVTMCEGRLDLDDGRRGTIIVTVMNVGSGRGSFVGRGAPPG